MEIMSQRIQQQKVQKFMSYSSSKKEKNHHTNPWKSGVKVA